MEAAIAAIVALFGDLFDALLGGITALIPLAWPIVGVLVFIGLAFLVARKVGVRK